MHAALLPIFLWVATRNRSGVFAMTGEHRVPVDVLARGSARLLWIAPFLATVADSVRGPVSVARGCPRARLNGWRLVENKNQSISDEISNLGFNLWMNFQRLKFHPQDRPKLRCAEAEFLCQKSWGASVTGRPTTNSEFNTSCIGTSAVTHQSI